MATAGPAFPTAAVTAAESPWLDNDWTTPGNVVSDDGTTASCTAASYDSPDQTFVLKATGFDFSAIPDGSTINGVTCRVNAWFASGQGSGSLDLCQLLDVAAAKVGTNQCSTPVALTTTTSTVITKGSASDQWGNSLTAAWVKDPDFGVALGVLATAANADVFIDYVTLEIDYTAAAPTGTLATTLAGATLAAAGAETISGTATSTLDGVTLAASGTETIAGTLASTLAGATFAASGTVEESSGSTGTLATTLAGATLTSSGTETISGTAASTFTGATLTASGTEALSGTLTTTLGGVTLTASGAETVTGTLASTLDGATLTASDSGSGVTGTLAVTPTGATLAASGTETISGTVAITMAGATFAASNVTISDPSERTLTVGRNSRTTTVGAVSRTMEGP